MILEKNRVLSDLDVYKMYEHGKDCLEDKHIWQERDYDLSRYHSRIWILYRISSFYYGMSINHVARWEQIPLESFVAKFLLVVKNKSIRT